MNIRISFKQYAESSHTAYIEPNLFIKIPKLLREHAFGNRYCIITDTQTKKIYGDDLLHDLKQKGLIVSLIAVTPGEHTKRFSTITTLCEKMVELGMRRDACVIALGGGVIGDLAGFIASIFMRGIPFVAIPTTLLSMVDASIGGKTGIDLIAGKNLVGTTHQPRAVFIDPILLKTLPQKELKNGIAEMVKHGVIKSRPLFLEIERNVDALRPDNTPLLQKLIIHNIKLKAHIIKNDTHEEILRPKSKQSRMLLNYGHTIGHAIEKASNYRIPHGEAISIGMVMENIIAVKKKLLSPGEAERIQTLLKKLRLPTRLPTEITPRMLLKILKNDKKNIAGKVHFVLPVRIGQAVIRGDIV